MPSVRASVPCQLTFRHGLAELVGALLWGARDRLVYQVVSAFNEAFTNVVAHSQLSEQQQLCVQVTRMSDRIEVSIEDYGIAYEPHFPQDDEDPDPMRLDAGGIGLLLIRRCMDEVSYQRTDKNVLLMVKHLDTADLINASSS